MHNKSNHKAS